MNNFKNKFYSVLSKNFTKKGILNKRFYYKTFEMANYESPPKSFAEQDQREMAEHQRKRIMDPTYFGIMHDWMDNMLEKKRKKALAKESFEEGLAALTAQKVDLRKPLIALSVSASRPSKLWGLEKYIRLTEMLREMGQPVILYDDIKALPAPFFEWIKKWAIPVHTAKLSTLMGCLGHAKLFIGSDSGVKHVAAALGTPTLTLFGPESVGEWHGYPKDHHRYLQIPVPCRFNDPEPKEFSWCGVERCPLASHVCLSLISPEMVLAEAQQLLLP